jgi:hypothetical protein
MNENLVEKDGVKYEFVKGGDCRKCDFYGNKNIPCCEIKCTTIQRLDRKDGHFKKVENV